MTPMKRFEELMPTSDPLDVMIFQLKDKGFRRPVDPNETNPKSIATTARRFGTIIQESWGTIPKTVLLSYSSSRTC